MVPSLLRYKIKVIFRYRKSKFNGRSMVFVSRACSRTHARTRTHARARPRARTHTHITKEGTQISNLKHNKTGNSLRIRSEHWTSEGPSLGREKETDRQRKRETERETYTQRGGQRETEAETDRHTEAKRGGQRETKKD